MEKIVVIPVKNEAWILPLSLACHSLWADKIIVADQNSEDNTVEICQQFQKVKLITNSNKEFNEAERRQILLDEVRKDHKQALIFALDADEILSAEVLEKKFWQELPKKYHQECQFQCPGFKYGEILSGIITLEHGALKNALPITMTGRVILEQA